MVKYRLEINDSRSGEGTTIWTDSFWKALELFLQERPMHHDSPPYNANFKTKLYKGRKLIGSIEHRKAFLPYYVKIHGGLTKEEYRMIKSMIGWNLVHNSDADAKHRGFKTASEKWHEYLKEEGIV